MKKRQTVYVTVYCTGVYSDYLEQVVGITDNKEQALAFAKQMADYVNSQEDWWFDQDNIVIREYMWNELQLNTSKAERSLYDLNQPKEIKVYKSSEGFSNKLELVEDD